MLKKYKKLIINLVFAGLLLAYFAIGFYHINTLGITNDEIAHLAAAQAYSQGQNVNIEHPALLKFLNSLVFSLEFPKFQSDNLHQWNRGKEIMETNIYSANTILANSRFVYLIFNSLLIFWLWVYTSFFGWLRNKVGISLAIFYVFSPSFNSHSNLITFDVSGSISIFMATFGLALTVLNWDKLEGKLGRLHTLILATTITLSLITKYSNIIALPIFVGAAIFGLSYFCRKNDLISIKKVLSLITTTLASFLLITYPLYFYCFRNTSTNPITNEQTSSILIPIYRYLDGVNSTFLRTGNNHLNFIDNQFVEINYLQLISRVFWFKENPVFILSLFLIFIWAIFYTFRNLQKNKFKLENFDFKDIFKNNIWAILFLIFPILYSLISSTSTLTIGYRHYYPVLIFVYAGVAMALSKLLKTKNQQILYVAILIGYILAGLAGVNQDTSYTNLFWRESKWKLANDSTLYWGQYEINTLKQLRDNNKIVGNINNQQLIFSTWSGYFYTPIYPSTQIMMLGINTDKKQAETFDVFTDLQKTKIDSLDYKYLVVDMVTIQRLTADKNNPIAQTNLEYILIPENQIFSKNEMIYVVEIWKEK